MSVKRPEHSGPPDLFYNETEARKYTGNSHMVAIQSEMSERALELLALPDDDEPKFILDIGCGSGLSGEVLSENGHYWVGLDISPAMLDVAREREVDGDVILRDIGTGVPFRAGTFDGAISISAIQWLCNADTSDANPRKRLYRFFSSLYAAMSRTSRVVLQFYPETPQQIELITQQATKAGFTGGLVVDFPNSAKAKKIFLVLFTGGTIQLPKGLDSEADQHQVHNAQRMRHKNARDNKNGKPSKKSREWIQQKKEKARARGDDVRPDSKYTGRKRKRM